MREALAMAGDDGIYLLMTWMVRSWSTKAVAYMHGKLRLPDLL